MRILVVNAFFPPLTTGSAHFSFDVARHYAKLGHEVLVIAAQVKDAPLAEHLDGIEVRRLPARWVSPGKLSFNYSLPFVTRPRVWRRLRSIIDEFRPDVIHQNGQFFDLTLWTTLVAWRARLPRVLTIHTPLTHTVPVARALISAVDRLVLRPFVNLGRVRVAAVDRFTMEMCQRRYRPRRHPVQFVPATLAIDAFVQGDGAKIRALHGLDNKHVVLSFGHVIPIRSRLPLVRALPALIELVPDVMVLVVGQVYDESFLHLADELGVRDRVITIGRVPHAEVPDFLAAADVESHDLDGHGLGITSFEVMAAGVPIVANVSRDLFPGIDLDDWPLLEIHDDLSAPELAARLARLLTAPADDRQAVVEQQRSFIAAHFGVDVVAEQYLDIFEQLESTS